MALSGGSRLAAVLPGGQHASDQGFNACQRCFHILINLDLLTIELVLCGQHPSQPSHNIFVLAEGRIIAEGTPAQVAADRAVIEAYLGQGAAKKLGGQA